MPEHMKYAWEGTGNFSLKVQDLLDEYVKYFEKVELDDAWLFYHKFCRYVMVLIAKFRASKNMSEQSERQLKKNARNQVNLLYTRRYGLAFDPRDALKKKKKSPAYRERPSRRRDNCSCHGHACFLNPRCPMWKNRIQCSSNCLRGSLCRNKFIEIDNEPYKVFKGITGMP